MKAEFGLWNDSGGDAKRFGNFYDAQTRRSIRFGRRFFAKILPPLENFAMFFMQRAFERSAPQSLRGKGTADAQIEKKVRKGIFLNGSVFDYRSA